jgi:hemolysin III
MSAPPRVKPRLRGVLHLHASYVALVAGIILVAAASSPRAALAAAVYGASLVTLFGVSALYHCPNWRPATRAWLRRLDHAAIFVLIAGSYTPFCLVALHGGVGHRLLLVAWIGAGLGILQSVFWVRAPRGISAALYLALGWAVVPYIPQIWAAIGSLGISLIVCCGVLFSVGAVIYALKRPDPLPAVFGYHEIFHALVVIACSFNYAAIAMLVV